MVPRPMHSGESELPALSPGYAWMASLTMRSERRSLAFSMLFNPNCGDAPVPRPRCRQTQLDAGAGPFLRWLSRI